MGVTDQGSFAQEAIAENYRRYLQPYLFDPWAQRLVSSVALARGQTVLDVAAGTGAVAHAAASIVGATGRVIASDISSPMLAALTQPESNGSRAAIETLTCSATAIELPDASVDVVFCHQGLPFMPDRVAVAQEMLRVLRPGGIVAVAVWALDAPLYPFDRYAEFSRQRLPESVFARTMASGALSMSRDSVAAALAGGGFIDVSASEEKLTIRWPSPFAEAHGINGTPFAAELAVLAADAREEFLADLALWLADDNGAAVSYSTTAVFGHGTAP
ncbi:class I SAM-dependent methyltransferase [Salinibacterium sp. M195]|uniref:class I SAM-dependent methyltransferase n=1 Tax=Salinibacterium sp. M195 TaxID=2583374 RepID=UPI001C6333BD|nr:class I SAM-dependent methyltransferase [Salinibacterium sp. M195]